MKSNLFLRIAALVLFILAVLVLFIPVNHEIYDGLIAAGLACWVGSTIG